MRIKRPGILLIALALLYNGAVYSKNLICPVKQNDAQNGECIIDHSTGIPFWICLNLVRQDILPSSRDVFVFLEPENFTVENLKAIFMYLSARFGEPEILTITVRSDREKLERVVSVYRYLSSSETQDFAKKRAAEVKLTEAFAAARNGCYRADYIRKDTEERFYYYPDLNKEDGFAVVLKSGPSEFQPTGDDISDLMRASKLGLTKYVKILLDHGAEVNARDKYGYTALLTAVLWRQGKVVDLLLDKGADLDIKGPNGWTALMFALQMSRLGETSIAEKLVRRGADVNAKSNDGETVLTLATKKGHTRIVEELLKMGADVNAKDMHGRTALMIAEEKGPKEIAYLLKRAGATR